MVDFDSYDIAIVLTRNGKSLVRESLRVYFGDLDDTHP